MEMKSSPNMAAKYGKRGRVSYVIVCQRLFDGKRQRNQNSLSSDFNNVGTLNEEMTDGERDQTDDEPDNNSDKEGIIVEQLVI